MKSNLKEVGKRIFDIRVKLDVTQEEFGEMIDGAKKGIVSRWENGLNLPNRKRLEIIAEKGNMSVNELLYGSFENYAYACITELVSDDELSGFELSDETKKNVIDIAVKQAIKNAIAYQLYDIGEFSKANEELYSEMMNAILRIINKTEFTNKGVIIFSSNAVSNILTGLNKYRENGVDGNICDDIDNILSDAHSKITDLHEKYSDKLN